MTTCYIADLHIGNHRRFGGPIQQGINDRCRHVLDALESALSYASQRGADRVIILGDTFDDVKPLPQVLAETARVMATAPMPIFVLSGNHDIVSSKTGDNALGPLAFVPNVHVIEHPALMEDLDETFLLIPFRSAPAGEWLEETVLRLLKERTRSGPVSLCVHMGISDETTPPYLKGAHDQIPANELLDIMARTGVNAAFAGNWHFHRQWATTDCMITQVGALASTGFDNPGTDYGRVVIAAHDPRTTLITRIPGGPLFFSLEYESGSLEDMAEYGADGHPVYVQIRAQPAYFEAAKRELAERKARKEITDGEVLPNREVTKAVARSAASAARNSTSINEAIHDYVEHIKKPEGITSADVLSRTKDYLAKNA